jgi:transcriptional regulator with XRE-family HTH domain
MPIGTAEANAPDNKDKQTIGLTLASYLANEMQKRHITPAQLSHESKVPIATVYRILRGDIDNPSISVSHRLCSALNLPLDGIFKFDESPSEETPDTTGLSHPPAIPDNDEPEVLDQDMSWFLKSDLSKFSTPQIRFLKSLLRSYRERAELAESLDAGMKWLATGSDELKDITANTIEAENDEILVMATSLTELRKAKYNKVVACLQAKIKAGVTVKFLITHPFFAGFTSIEDDIVDDSDNEDLRQLRENLGIEAINSLRLLRTWGVKAEWVRLYQGFRICFVIRTTNRILMSLYPYGAAGEKTPSVVIDRQDPRNKTRCDEMEAYYFSEWDGSKVVPVRDYGTCITELDSQLSKFSGEIRDIISKYCQPSTIDTARANASASSSPS